MTEQSSKPSPKGAFAKWALLGALVAALLLVSQTIGVGGIEGLLQVGTKNALYPVIASELDDLPVAEHVGHDGQVYYAVGLDLSGDEMPEYLKEPAYRYRRILFSTVASVFGILDGQPLLLGMIITVIASSAAAAGGTAATARLLGRSDWLALTVILNPGLWLSIRLLTAEILATGLMALGLLAYLANRRSSSILAFSFSVLTKEMFLLTPAGLSVGRDRSRWSIALVPAAVILTWTAWVALRIGGTEGVSNNLTLPFVGIAEATRVWPLSGPSDWFYLVVALLSVGSALLLGVFSRGWLRWSLLAWAVLGICSSWFVWRIGNNAARVFSPVLVLLGLQLSLRSPASSIKALVRRDSPSTMVEHRGAH